MRVRDLRILVRRRMCAGCKEDSISSAGVEVVRKVPRMAFIAVLWADSSLSS